MAIMNGGRRLDLRELNSAQYQAVTHVHGPLLILAGAGSGKTKTMAYRMAYLIADKGVPGSQILGLSFTNKAAEELRERVHSLVRKTAGPSAVKGLTVSTFHSLCVRILREESQNLPFSSPFTILDSSDQVDILRQVLKNLRFDDRKFDVKTVLFHIGQAKNRFLNPAQAEAYFFEQSRMAEDYAIAAHSCYERYQDQLRARSALDFDDLIFYAVHLLKNKEEVRRKYQERFRFLLVDEYQDTNQAQFQILQSLTDASKNLCVVGDDDQSIYAWRGADPTHILSFQQHYPQAKVILLDQNYRSTSKILEAAYSVISKNRHRYPKKLWSARGMGESLIEIIVEEDRAEAEYVAKEIWKLTQLEKTRTYHDIAVLYRSHSQSRVFEEAFRRHQIPYKIVGGLSFLDRKEVKDVISYWKLVLNPNDDTSLRRVINWPARGIGMRTLEKLNQIAIQSQKPLFETFSKENLQAAEVGPKVAQAVLQFRSTLHEMRQTLDGLEPTPANIAQWARTSLEKLGIKQAVLEENEDAKTASRKWENVEELAHSLGQMGEPEQELNGSGFLQEFLNRVTLQSLEGEPEREKGNEITLLTLHGAKGLEFPIVFLVGMEEGFLPHRRILEEVVDLGEERRLCYVGITRAKDQLYMTRAKSRIRYGKSIPRDPSRFLEDIPRELRIQTFLGHSSQTHTAEQKEEIRSYLDQIRAALRPR